jgi:hypothetical protein
LAYSQATPGPLGIRSHPRVTDDIKSRERPTGEGPGHANPDLVERLRTGVPVAPVDEATYYQGGDAGYLTYPAYQCSA